MTDVEFIYTPSQIALAAFRLSEPNAIENWLGLKESLQDPSSTNHLEHDLLLECLETIGSIILKSETDGVDTEAVRAVDLRLRWARNPEKDPESAL